MKHPFPFKMRTLSSMQQVVFYQSVDTTLRALLSQYPNVPIEELDEIVKDAYATVYRDESLRETRKKRK